MNDIRLNKAIADSGLTSRRKADDLIDAGKVFVNGKMAQMGQRVKASDEITVRGRRLPKHETVTIVMNKPAGVITTKSDPHHYRTIMTLLPKNWQHLKPAGRLDKDSEGLIILSSDGPLIQKLTHPKHGHTKTYEILVKGYAKLHDLLPLGSGKLMLDGHKLNPIQFKILGTLKSGKTRIKLTLTEGRNRQIRRVMDQLGYPVIYLRRIQIGQLTLGDLKSGQFHELSPEDITKALS